MHIAFVTTTPLPRSARGVFTSPRRPPISSRLPWSANLHGSHDGTAHDAPAKNCKSTSFRTTLKSLSLAVSLALLPLSSSIAATPSFGPGHRASASHVASSSTNTFQRDILKKRSTGVILASARSSASSSSSDTALLSDSTTTTVPAKLRTSSVKSRIAKKLSSISIQERLSFYFSEFLMWNPAAKVVSLFAFILLCMFLGSLLYRVADPKREEAPYPFWHAVRAIANPLEDDWQKNTLRATSIFLASFGMVIFAILVGMVTETVQSAVENANGEKSRVIANNHVVVCGWGSHVAQILKDVAAVSPNFKVAILAPSEHRADMIDQMRATMTDEERNRLKVFFRSGAPEIPQDLHRVAASRASKIILVNPKESEPVDGDRLILSHALALRQNLPSFTGDVVAELNTARDESIFRSVLANSHASSVQTINTNKLLFRFMAQAIGQPGLADVVARLMGEDPSSVFHIATAKEAAPQLIGTAYSDLRPTSIPGCLLCGFVGSDGKVYIETGIGSGMASETLKPTTKLLLLGTSKSMDGSKMAGKTSTFDLSTSISTLVHSGEWTPSEVLKRKKSERYLVLGWRHDMEYMLQELDTIVGRGSKVTVVDEDVPSRLPLSLKNIDLSLVQKRADRYDTIEEVINSNRRGKPWDHVVVLGSAISDEGDDSKTLASVIYVNDALSKVGNYGKNTIVTVEFINEGVAEMVKDEKNVGNAILPQNLGAKIAAQTVRDSHLNTVWQELLSQEGREVYLRPLGAYEAFVGKHTSFAMVSDSLARSDNDIVIGFIGRFDSKVTLNPQGDDRFTARGWHKDDVLIVLSKQ